MDLVLKSILISVSSMIQTLVSSEWISILSLPEQARELPRESTLEESSETSREFLPRRPSKGLLRNALELLCDHFTFGLNIKAKNE